MRNLSQSEYSQLPESGRRGFHGDVDFLRDFGCDPVDFHVYISRLNEIPVRLPVEVVILMKL